jgi:hypothetical protein
MDNNKMEKLIKRILKEESKREKMVNHFITSLIKPNGNFKEEYKDGRFDITDNNDNLVAVIFFNNRKDAMEVMVDEKVWGSLYEMFSMKTWDEVNNSLVKWFQENYYGLEEIEEVNTFDNAEYAY